MWIFKKDFEKEHNLFEGKKSIKGCDRLKALKLKKLEFDSVSYTHGFDIFLIQR